jgi:hypothetical protein
VKVTVTITTREDEYFANRTQVKRELVDAMVRGGLEVLTDRNVILKGIEAKVVSR